MDDHRFDALTRGLERVLNRRAAGTGALGGMLAILGIAAGPTDAEAQRRFESQHCLPNQLVCKPANPKTSTRRGTRHRHGCDRCCSGYSVKVRRGRRCACRPTGMKAKNQTQCCSGRRRGGRCFEPTGPVTADLLEVGSATLTSLGASGCSNPGEGGTCTEAVAGNITGSPIDGTLSGTVAVTNWQVGPGPIDRSGDLTGTFTVTDTPTGHQLFVNTSGVLDITFFDSDPPLVIYTGTYLITGGTGRFAGASGSGTVEASGEATAQTTTELRLFTMDGTITTVG